MSQPVTGESVSTDPSDSSRKLHVGSRAMPPWNIAELPESPRFNRRQMFALIGPSIIAGGAAIGGGEWLMGPAVTARYGAAMMWLATISILFQGFYNVEISRYALYSGEPIMNGKFRTMPGPAFWLWTYVILDIAAIFPYLAANAATPLARLILGRMPDSSSLDDQWKMRILGYCVFLLCCTPMIFGGKIYRSLRALMTFKIITVLGFLLVLAIFYSSAATWKEITLGFVRFGTIPTRAPEDTNGNGILDPGEIDWDGDGHADVMEPEIVFVTTGTGKDAVTAPDFTGNGQPDALVEIQRTIKTEAGEETITEYWPDLDGDGLPDETVTVQGRRGESVTVQLAPQGDRRTVFRLRDTNRDGSPDAGYVDVDGDGTRDGDQVLNVFSTLWETGKMPPIDLSMIAFLAAFAAIAGNGGLTNVPISNFTRDQGWGMGAHVGAIPSMVGGVNVELSHEGSVFIPDEQSLPRWKRWLAHVRRDQFLVWLPACFVGVALPSMLSLVFLKRGTQADSWTAATMTSQGVYDRVYADAGQTLANFCWFMVLFCGFLVLATAMAAMIDGFVRRWVDVFWCGSPRLRTMDTKNIKYVYFGVLCVYACFGLVMLSFSKPMLLVAFATNAMNFAFGFSAWHTVYVNHTLLPKPLRPGWFTTTMLVLAGVFFHTLATLALLQNLGYIST